VEDDLGLAREIGDLFRRQGWTADHVGTGEEGLKRAAAHPYDVLIVDRMLPALDGLTVLQRLRGMEIMTPTLILSALGELEDKVAGLDGGADDYLVKPFAHDELCARVRVLSRRSQPHPAVLTIKDLEIWTKARRAYRAGEFLKLTPKEFDLLHYLAVNEGIVVTKQMILQHVFHVRHADPNLVVVHVFRLRDKVDRDHLERLIGTVRGEGYVLNPEA
jgi:two-component system OmpR family response regulator